MGYTPLTTSRDSADQDSPELVRLRKQLKAVLSVCERLEWIEPTAGDPTLVSPPGLSTIRVWASNELLIMSALGRLRAAFRANEQPWVWD
jgi:hypothetical protein